jgi:uncharacterized Zn finger protein
MAKTASEMIQTAIARASGRTAAVHFITVTPAGYAVYSVGSSQDVETAYSVTVSPAGAYRCTCPSEMRAACWHRAGVAIVRASRQGHGLPADGPNAQEARPAAA